ncbi:G1 family glutamic endopeptidase [Candidatus Protochlamydia phocaeensis]|uniref:G1 family glutamic endopeptidase n=1 Tax=Candidatus Protochlamydia phocaeensis TaxID=1414722 RepID=UPI00083834FE|nr:G1 family glutamic endopeptidase [Candidatus Protochlamydia phocaeensis]
MKKVFFCGFFFLLSMTRGFAETETQAVPSSDLLPSIDEMVQIECKLEPICPLSDRYLRHQHSRLRRGSRPHFAVKAGTSTNWSGYVAATNLQNPAPGSVSAIAGIWLVPTLAPTPNNAYSAIWVGIDGYSNGTVEQIGTGHDWVNGAQDNYAWFEMYPNPMHEIIGFPVNNNDLIGAISQYIGNGVFQLSIFNYTKGVSAVIPTNFTIAPSAQRSSAEWIVEAPSSSQGVLPLANFRFAAMVNCVAIINGVLGPINNPLWQSDVLYMIQSNYFKAIPTPLAPGGAGFITLWEHE